MSRNFLLAVLIAASVSAHSAMRGVQSPSQFSQADFTHLGSSEYKANLIRWQIGRNFGLPNTDRDITEYNSWLAAELIDLDRALTAAQANGMKVVVHIGTAPGGRYSDLAWAMFYEPIYNARFVEIWKEMATRYKDNPAVWAYDIINEPTQNRTVPPAGLDSRSTQIKVAQAIRVIDPTTPIIFEPHAIEQYGSGQGTFTNLVPVTGITNLWYETHLYNFSAAFLRPSGTGCYPGQADGYTWNKELLRAIIQPVRAFQTTHGVKIYVGEFSIPVGSCGATAFLSDHIDLFEEYGWDWTYHAYREAPMWSMEAADRKPLFLEWFSRNVSLSPPTGLRVSP